MKDVKRLIEVDRLRRLAARKAEADKEAALWQAVTARRAAELRSRQATADAFDMFARNSGLFDRFVAELGRALGDRLGDELRPHAEKLRNCARDQRRAPRLYARGDDPLETSVLTITGEVPALHYCIAVARGLCS